MYDDRFGVLNRSAEDRGVAYVGDRDGGEKFFAELKTQFPRSINESNMNSEDNMFTKLLIAPGL